MDISSADRNKDISFYTELIIITVVVMVIANIWSKFIKQGIEELIHPPLLERFLIALAITLVGVYVLLKLYGKPRNKEEGKS